MVPLQNSVRWNFGGTFAHGQESPGIKMPIEKITAARLFTFVP